MDKALQALGDNPTNVKDLSELEKNLRQLVPFVGAGLSADFDYPMWGQFLQETANESRIGEKVVACWQSTSMKKRPKH
jgi:hypothetical protein